MGARKTSGEPDLIAVVAVVAVAEGDNSHPLNASSLDAYPLLMH
jgi:hypothetical protein